METDNLTEYLQTQNLKYNKTRRAIFTNGRPMDNADVDRMVLETTQNGRKLKRSVIFNAALAIAHLNDYSETKWAR